MANKLIQVYVREDFEKSIKAIQDAFILQGYTNMFSPFCVNAIIYYFENKDWGQFLKDKPSKVYTTEQITHDVLQNDLHADKKWVMLE